MNQGRVLGLDVGEARTGVAVSDELGMTARPLTVVATAELLPRLSELIKEHDIRRLVVGRPRHLDGSLGEQADRTTELVAPLQELPVEIVFEDETATTVNAPGGSDDEAACVMLQGYLDEQTT